MKIFLWTDNEWKLYNSEDKNFKDELSKRNIFIGNYAEIGDFAKIGNYAEIGDFAKIGYSAEIGNSTKIGYSATIGYFAKIGNYAEIGDFAKIGYYAKIGDFAKIGKDNILSAYSLFYHFGIITNKNIAIVYKAIQENLTDYHTGEYQYIIGKGDEKDLKPNQAMDCGEGWHFLNLEGAIKWHKEKGSKGKIISAEIDIKDILHIGWKVRVRAFKNVQLVDVDYLL